MSGITYRRHAIAVDLPSAPEIPMADTSPVVPVAPPDVDGYWLFGADNPGLIDQVAGQALAQNLSIAITNRGTGYTVRPQVALSGGGGTGWELEAIRADTEISGVAVVKVGTPFSSPPTVIFTGGTTGTPAQAVASIGAAPTINDISLTIPASPTGVRNGLLSPFDDSRDQTEYAVVRAFAAGGSDNSVIVGSIGLSGEGGDGIFWQPNNYRVTTRTRPADTLAATGIIAGKPLFVAVRHRSLDNKRSVVLGINGALVAFEATVTKSIASPMRKVAFGNAHLVGTGFYGATELFAGGYAAGYQSDDDVNAMYERVRYDLAQRSERLQ